MASRLNNIYWGMIARCNRPNNPAYYLYGGRGISVCDSWMTGFKPFKEWALAHGYSEGLTIDRINNNKGYSPENCRWVTMKEQIRNRRIAIKLSINGVEKTLWEWCEQFGLSYTTALWRAKRWGLTADIFSCGVLGRSKPRKVYATKNGKEYSFDSMREAARWAHRSDTAIRLSIERGGICGGMKWRY